MGMVTAGEELAAPDGITRRRIVQAGVWAVLGVPGVLMAATLVLGRDWRLDGVSTLALALLVAFVAATAAAWARTAPWALGCMAAEVLAAGSLLRGADGIVGVAFALAAGLLGAWVGSILAPPNVPIAEVPGGERALLRLSLGLGAVALLAGLVPVGRAAEEPNAFRPYVGPQWAPPSHAHPCVADSTPIESSGAVIVALGSNTSTSVPVGRPLAFHVSARVDDEGAFPGRPDMGQVDLYVTARPVVGEGSFSGWIGSGHVAGGPTGGTVKAGRSWNGHACPSRDASFTTVARPGVYEVRAVALVGDKAWASAPVELEVVEASP